MMVLGLDTSNYTTSAAAFDGVSGKNCSRLLDVKEGELGLRQSDALFSHVKRLPELVSQLFAELPRDEIGAIGASTRPRAVEGSYMPCFLAGESQARTLAPVPNAQATNDILSPNASQPFWMFRSTPFLTSRGTSRRPAGHPAAWI